MSRFITDKAWNFINGINSELLDGVVMNPVIIYKISPETTTINLYGEAMSKDYYSGVQLYSLIDAQDISTEQDPFQTTLQEATFNFQRETLRGLNLYPEHGDIIFWNDKYFEIDNIRGNTRLGGLVDYSVAIICETHMTQRDRLAIEQRVF